MTRRLHRRAGPANRRKIAGISVVAALGLGAAACSSTPAATNASGSGGRVTISVDCAPPASAPQQHKE
ncbi:MAG TPA: hypothetical protein VJ371_21265, partial [Streptosporangiaceae bacterium]|nr:hypothetical protein [Streptosporangiaceae bacterium]